MEIYHIDLNTYMVPILVQISLGTCAEILWIVLHMYSKSCILSPKFQNISAFTIFFLHFAKSMPLSLSAFFACNKIELIHIICAAGERKNTCNHCISDFLLYSWECLQTCSLKKPNHEFFCLCSCKIPINFPDCLNYI